MTVYKKAYSRRRFLFLGAMTLLASAIPLFRSLASPDRKKSLFLKNESLSVIKKGYAGNPFVDGRFVNEVPKPKIPFGEVMKWRMTRKKGAAEKMNDLFALPVHKNRTMFESGEDMLVWFGHATFFIRLDGVSFLTDPCLRDIMFVERYIGSPCDLADIKNIDYLLISHSHRDHLDEGTMKELDLRGTRALVPLKMGELVSSMNKNLTVEEAGWYQRYTVRPGSPEVYLMPAQHWSQRFVKDVNQVLWGSYVIRGKKKSVYFAGDSAYAPHFKTVGSLFPGIDVCLMPIGAYRPASIMQGSHLSPWESLDAFHDLGGKTFIPMHYGTYNLADEPRGEPIRVMSSLRHEGKINGELKTLEVGEIYPL